MFGGLVECGCSWCRRKIMRCLEAVGAVSFMSKSGYQGSIGEKVTLGDKEGPPSHQEGTISD